MGVQQQTPNLFAREDFAQLAVRAPAALMHLRTTNAEQRIENLLRPEAYAHDVRVRKMAVMTRLPVA